MVFGCNYDYKYYLFYITIVGYGDYIPKTVVGRIIGLVCCMIGIILLTLLVVALVMLTVFNDDELKVYYP